MLFESLLPGIFPLQDPIALVAVVAVTIMFSFWLLRFKFFKNAGIVFTVVLVAIVLSNLGIAPQYAPTFDIIYQFGIPLSITLMLMEVDLKKIIKLAKQPMLAMLLACLSVCIMAFSLGLIFAPQLDEGWKLAGMFVGTYTGGSPNLTAIGAALGTSASNIAAANAADYVGCMPALVILFALPPILKRSKKFQKLWPYSIADEDMDVENYHEIGDDLSWSIVDITKMLGIATTVYFISNYLSKLFPESFQSAAEVLLITTLSIAVAQLPFVRKLKGAMDLGTLVSLWFLAVIGYMVNIKDFFNSAWKTAIFVILILVGCTLLHALLCRLFKIPYQYMLTSIMAGIWDGPSAALLAISAEWKSIVAISVVMGTVGHALGNYLGIMVSYAVKAVLGL